MPEGDDLTNSEKISWVIQFFLMPFVSGSCSFLSLVGLLSVSFAVAETVTISASAWGTARDADRDGSFETTSLPTQIAITRQSIANYAERGVWEFNLSELHAGMTGIDLQVLVTNTSLDRANFDLYGYAGNGTIETTDAVGGTLLA